MAGSKVANNKSGNKSDKNTGVNNTGTKSDIFKHVIEGSVVEFEGGFMFKLFENKTDGKKIKYVVKKMENGFLISEDIDNAKEQYKIDNEKDLKTKMTKLGLNKMASYSLIEKKLEPLLAKSAAKKGGAKKAGSKTKKSNSKKSNSKKPTTKKSASKRKPASKSKTTTKKSASKKSTQRK